MLNDMENWRDPCTLLGHFWLIDPLLCFWLVEDYQKGNNPILLANSVSTPEQIALCLLSLNTFTQNVNAIPYGQAFIIVYICW